MGRVSAYTRRSRAAPGSPSRAGAATIAPAKAAVLGLAFGWALWSSRVAAAEPAGEEPEGEYHAVVHHAPDDPQATVDRRSPGFATAIDLEDEQGARPADGLAELLARSPGVSARSLGGLGQFSAISIRGSSPQQVAVFLDGVPIGSSMAGLVDLSELPLEALGRAVIYRGIVPVAFGSAAIGGAVNLETRRRCDAPRGRIAAGAGSFSTRQASVSADYPLTQRTCLQAQVGYAGTLGNFRFLDTRDTPLVPDDDVDARRRNNAHDRLLARVAVHGRRGAWRYHGQQLVYVRDQGIAGPATAQARATSLETVSAKTLGGVERRGAFGPGGRAAITAGFGVERRRLLDPLGEVGIAVNDQQTRAFDVFLQPGVRVPLWREAFLEAVVDERVELVRVDERARLPGDSGPSGDARRRRSATGAGVSLEQLALDRRIQLSPALRVDVVYSRFAVAPGEGEQDDAGRDHAAIGVSPRLGLRVRLVDALELRATVGRYFRPPTLAELFGDRGYAVGNEGLVPERGTAADGGFVITHASERLTLRAHVAAFASAATDLIQWIKTAQVIRPVNVARARVAGLESGLSLAALRGDVELTASYTLLDARNLGPEESAHGKQLPGRPRHRLFARAAGGHEFDARGHALAPRLFYTFEYVAGTFLDASERYEVPGRALHGLGVELHVARRLHLAVEARNLLNTRVTTWTPPIEGVGPLPAPISDFIGYPLPGLSVLATLRVDLDLPRPKTRTKGQI
ncbi:MAG: TonB-dependent receptor [Nannocystaceae bacterium]